MVYGSSGSDECRGHVQYPVFAPNTLSLLLLLQKRQLGFCFVFLYLIVHACCELSCFSNVQLFATLWTVTHQTPLSMDFSRQEYWSGLPFLSPGYLLDPGIELASLASPALALAGRFFTISAAWGAPVHTHTVVFSSL